MAITVTEAAKSHFLSLLKAEDERQKRGFGGTNIHLFVSNPGTVDAEVGLAFSAPEEEQSLDVVPLQFDEFKLLIEREAFDSLKEASIDLQEDQFGAQLSIKAPYLKGMAPGADSPLHERIAHVLVSEINPGLAAHKGQVSLVDVLEGGIVVLQFGGGCHGCGMVNLTLKDGIERTLKERFPEITEVRDSTDHATGENPYFT